MGLAALQAAAARLSVDAAARRRLRDDPASFAAESALAAGELATLQEKAAEFDTFARSLLNKRAGEAARAIPLTAGALGGSYRRLFDTFAEEVGVARDPVFDAFAFLRWVVRMSVIADSIRDLARYETAALHFRRSDRLLTLGIFRVRRILPMLPRPFPKLFIACWWRPSAGAPIRYFQWPSC